MRIAKSCFDPTASEPYKRGFLAYVWETVGRLALEQVLGTAEAKARNGAAGALEEDSRLTALFLWTLQTTESESDQGDVFDVVEDSDDNDDEQPKKSRGNYTLIYDVARRFAQQQQLIADLRGTGIFVLAADNSGKSLSYWNHVKAFWFTYFKETGIRIERYSALRECAGITQ